MMRLTSSHFKHSTSILSRYTCEGKNISPLLEWDQVSKGIKSFVLIVLYKKKRHSLWNI